MLCIKDTRRYPLPTEAGHAVELNPPYPRVMNKIGGTDTQQMGLPEGGRGGKR